MILDGKLNQLTSLLADLVPTVDKLAAEFWTLTNSNHKSNLERAELRLSNLKLADAIESLVSRVDKVEDLNVRIKKIEDHLGIE